MMSVTKGFGLTALFLVVLAGAAGQAVGVTVVPEPSTFAMSGIGLVTMGVCCAWRRGQWADA